jgi:hypothetical protein
VPGLFVRLLLCLAVLAAVTIASAAVGGCQGDRKEVMIDGHVRSGLPLPR